MKIDENSKLGVALSVLRNINMEASDVGIDTYSNCREQGFFVTSYHSNCRDVINGRRAVSFSENRNSDDIIVQWGMKEDFNDYGVISEEKYTTNKKYFRYDDAEGAAAFITKWLTYK